ncbi:MAG: MerR family transcriptional regulator [Patescibacteria group bacterium]|nr:MerR family transcriptional regulator [Patescibacteria group bacterium]
MDTKREKLLTIKQVASILNVHLETLRRWDNAGNLKSIRVSSKGHRRYRKSEIEKLISNK